MATSSAATIIAAARLFPLRVKFGDVPPVRIGGDERVQYGLNLVNRALIAVNNMFVAAPHAENDNIKHTAPGNSTLGCNGRLYLCGVNRDRRAIFVLLVKQV